MAHKTKVHQPIHIDLENLFTDKEKKKTKFRVSTIRRFAEAGVASRTEIDIGAELSLSDKQNMAVKMLTFFHQSMSFNQVARAVGVDRKTLAAWRAEPIFRRKLDQAISDNQNIMRLEAHKTLFKAIKAGDLKAAIKYLEMTGDIRDEMTVNLNDLSKLDSAQLDDEIETMEKALGHDSSTRTRSTH